MKKIFIIAVIGLFVMGLGAWYVIFQANQSRIEAIDIYGEVPAFEFTAHSGEPFGIGNMKGTLSVVDFIFTSCQSACPIMSATMKELYQIYHGSGTVQFVSFSVDPDVDTLPVLRDYARMWGVDDKYWTFVRAPVEDIKNLSEQGFYLPAEGLPMGHSTRFALVDQNGKIRGYYDSFDPESMAELKTRIDYLADEM